MRFPRWCSILKFYSTFGSGSRWPKFWIHAKRYSPYLTRFELNFNNVYIKHMILVIIVVFYSFSNFVTAWRIRIKHGVHVDLLLGSKSSGSNYIFHRKADGAWATCGDIAATFAFRETDSYREKSVSLFISFVCRLLLQLVYRENALKPAPDDRSLSSAVFPESVISQPYSQYSRSSYVPMRAHETSM